MGAVPLAAPLEEHHAGGHGDVQRCNGTSHGDSHKNVAVLPDVLVYSVALAAQDQHRWFGVFDTRVDLFGAFIQSIDPESLLFELFEGLGNVTSAHYRSVFESTSGRLGYRFRKSSGSAFG